MNLDQLFDPDLINFPPREHLPAWYHDAGDDEEEDEDEQQEQVPELNVGGQRANDIDMVDETAKQDTENDRSITGQEGAVVGISGVG